MKNRVVSTTTAMNILADAGTDVQEMAQRHGVSHQTIRLYKMLRLDCAKEIAEKMRAAGMKVVLWPEGKPGAKRFSDDQVRAIRCAKGTSAKLAKHFGCSAAMIRMIKLRRSYANVKDLP